MMTDELPDEQVLTESTARWSPSRLLLTLFGACAGFGFGAIAGAMACWSTGAFDFLPTGVQMGGTTVSAAGALFAWLRKVPDGSGDQRPIATTIGFCVGLIVALSLMINIFGGGMGGVGPVAAAGALFIFPMGGLLLGAFMDRALDEATRKAWVVSAAFGIIAITACVSLVQLIDSRSYGPQPAEMSAMLEDAIPEDWQYDERLKHAIVDHIELSRTGRRTYSGHLDVTHNGAQVRLKLNAQDQDRAITWEHSPLP